MFVGVPTINNNVSFRFFEHSSLVSVKGEGRALGDAEKRDLDQSDTRFR